MSAEQLPLPLRTADPWPGFAQFVTGEEAGGLQALQARLPGAVAPVATPLLLIGPTGSGKSHLLGAAMPVLEAAGAAARLLPLRRLVQVDPEAIGLQQDHAWVLLDDVDAVLGAPAWDRALFALLNRLHDAGLPWLASARSGPAAWPEHMLPDLRSRLAQAQQAVLTSADTATRHAILRQRAAERGLELPQPVLDWLDVHHSRDLQSQLRLLDALDRYALSRARRITLPLVRECLALHSVEPTARD